MAGKYIAQTSTPLTANGGTSGYATVANNNIVMPGAKVYLYSTAKGSQPCVVTDLSGTTLIGLRFISDDPRQNAPQYGVKSNLTGFNTTDTATLNVPAQVVDEWNAYKAQ